MRQSAHKIMMVNTVLLSFCIVPLGWLVPLTVNVGVACQDGDPDIRLGLYCIFFAGPLGWIAGSLLIISAHQIRRQVGGSDNDA